MYNLSVVGTSTKNLLDTDVINVEFNRVGGHRVDASFYNFLRKEIFNAKLLGGNHSLDATLKFNRVTRIDELVACKSFK